MPEAMDAYRQVIARRPDMGLAYRRLAFLQWEGGARRSDRHAAQRSAEDRPGYRHRDHASGPTSPKPATAQQAIPMLERVTAARREELARRSTPSASPTRGPGAELTRAARPSNGALAANPRDVFAHENIGTVYLQQRT